MKTIIKYQCEVCGHHFDDPDGARRCEADCTRLSPEEYSEYLGLLYEEKSAFGAALCKMNSDTRKRCDNAIDAVLRFQERHQMKGKKLPKDW